MPDRFFYPRPEYPRPDRQRGFVEGVDWVNLNGPWQFRFDGERQGIAEKWFKDDALEWREQIIVPFCWESLAAWGEGDTAGNDNYYSSRVFRKPLEVSLANHRSADRYEVGWYRRRVTVPPGPEWEGKRAILTVGAADFFTDCWCNGVYLGRHEGGYTPFEFDITDALDPQREGLLVLRVEDPMDNAQQPVGKQWRWYTTTSGIWQTVFLEPRHATSIVSFQVLPDIDAGIARFRAGCVNAGEGCSLELEITGPDGTQQRVMAAVSRNFSRQDVKLERLVLWDPNAPALYRLVLRLKRAHAVLDTVHSYFGMRKIDFAISRESGVPTALRVNNVSRYLRGALYQSYHPDGVYTAGSVETVKDDIAYAKKFGFNFLRIHIKIDDPLLLYWADKMGMLLMADFPNFGEGGDTALGRRRFEEMMRNAIKRDFNHPSIFAWCLFNETWGFGGQCGFIEKILELSAKKDRDLMEMQAEAVQAGAPVQKSRLPARAVDPDVAPPQEWVQSMWELAKQLDPTRLVEDMSVCHWDHLEYYQHCDTDINSWHFYIDDYAKAKEHIEKVVGSTFVGSTFNYVPGFLHKGQPLINSEYGGVGALDGDRDVSWSFKFLTNELRRHPQIAAYIYTELHDVEWEYNGFLNYDRTPKQFGYDPRLINESNTLPIDAPPVQKVDPGSRVQVPVASSHYSTRHHQDVYLHWEMGGIDTRGRLHQGLARGRVPIPFPHHKVAPAHTLELPMPAQPMLCTLTVTAVSVDATVLARNFVHFLVSQGYPPPREEADRAVVLRCTAAEWVAADWSRGGTNRSAHQSGDACWGDGAGFFEWLIPIEGIDLAKARRIKVLCEASSHRTDHPQTDDLTFPTTFNVLLNGVLLYHGVLRDHPHDARGVLSYWRGGKGAYGYLVKGFAEGETIRQIASASAEGLRLRCAVPPEALARGGLTIYGAECGRFPVTPTVIVEWW